ncbi:MAG: primosomal protein N' [Pseudodesulfovibrio sp.]|uniref:Replication restart protein PriA n=1 Tax=Pseudodesulfovibrio aespoeensis (strain ATCC 700646 / DSM 10631 / Aspo-2) TaxID=643562 RepID=E6VUN5_PSEA9|nr:MULTISPECIES: primosomal protein N' [Pseudodesulfovibrio]MBU4193295.1 primosomal protein N' [Pseudomonadota bacterium]ADU62276.1 primosomal protein N' [Pseudodesulfovibrio aespoeensis Aspo-2]MBU4243326.1 primosomal protein N' [Pseudomonadota bacterium]MBU4380492.1 primosomal protein N' [Pseudomonadota bacterium]MBU4474059.1 primosomal protein N' [Pseudomonadota bacterium]
MADLWQVTLVSPPYQALTYERPRYFPEIGPGQRVIVPLGRSHRVGVVIGPAAEAPQGVVIKPLIWPLEPAPLLDKGYIELVHNLATRQMARPGRILETLLPRGLRTAAVVFRVDRHVADRPLPGTVRPADLARLPLADREALMELWLAGRMRVRVNIKREEEERFASLVSDPPWAVRPNAKRQIRILEHLLDNGPQSLFSLRHALGEWAVTTVAKMEGVGLVALGELTADRLAEVDAGPGRCQGIEPAAFALTDEQRVALDELIVTMDGSGGAHLVHGVTGSGKTVLYLELVRACLARGRSSMLLAPEVALSCRLFRTVAEHFPQQRVVFYHGYQSPMKRETAFVDAARGDGPVIVIGTRSALFLPVPDLGLVVLDEEHDESFKQEERLSYHAKEVAWFRVERSGGLLVLGSATPDVKTFHAARTGAIAVSTLTRRVGESVLPAVELVDISAMAGSAQPFAPATIEAVRQTVAEGHQVIVMLNRRGYAPLMYCLDCAETVRCPECEVGMTYHKGRERVICHYCGLSHSYPLLCAKCGGGNFVPMGDGTERLEEYLGELLPDGVTVLRLDRDATRRQERMEEILGAFDRGEAQVLVGTQMISKGHHFPGVTLVVVADGDLGLSLPDYRSTERTFQLLVQVAGRAGRGDDPGRVLIQTRNPGHPIWRDVLSGDYPAFFEREIGRRRLFGYPPFSRLALVRISHPADYADGPAALELFAKVLSEKASGLGIVALGPAPAPFGMLRGRKRFNCLFKGDDWGRVRTLYAHLVQANPCPDKIRLGLDLDPLTTL